MKDAKQKKKAKKVKHPLAITTKKQRAMAGVGLALGTFLLRSLVNTIFDQPAIKIKQPAPGQKALRVLTDAQFKAAEKEAGKIKENE